MRMVSAPKVAAALEASESPLPPQIQEALGDLWGEQTAAAAQPGRHSWAATRRVSGAHLVAVALGQQTAEIPSLCGGSDEPARALPRRP